MENCKLNITIIEAKDLMAADFGGTSDPYVKIKDVPGLHGKGAKTEYKKKTLTPTWNEKFQFEFNYKMVTLRFKVYDHDMVGSDDEIGKCSVPISTLMDGHMHGTWLPLVVSTKGGAKKMKGELHVNMQAQWAFPIAVIGQWIPVRGLQCAVGLGWDFSKKKPPVDLDASVVALSQDNQKQCVVSFRALQGFGGAIRHSGDNRTGEGKGDDEQIFFELSRIPPNVTKLAVIVNSFNGQELTAAKSAYLRLFDNAGTSGFFRLTTMVASTGLFFGVFMKNPAGQWFFQIIARPTPGRTVDQSLPEVVNFINSCHF